LIHPWEPSIVAAVRRPAPQRAGSLTRPVGTHLIAQVHTRPPTRHARGNHSIDARGAKAALRARLLAARLALTPDEVRRRGEAAQAAMAALLESAAPRTVALYGAMRKEVPTDALHRRLAARGVRVAYPLVTRGRPTLSFHVVDDPSALAPAGFGVPSPDPRATEEAPVSSLDVVVVPGLAFDRAGRRLGYGAGYYDRTVAGLPPARLVGLGYDFQVVDALPVEPHDLRLSAVATEAGVYGARP
jgi:5-formyltetrahydrofolate cyclo-ligase